MSNQISDESREKLKAIDWQEFAEDNGLNRQEFEQAILVAAASVLEVNMMMQSHISGKKAESMVIQLNNITLLATTADISSTLQDHLNAQQKGDQDDDDPFNGAFDNDDDVFHA